MAQLQTRNEDTCAFIEVLATQQSGEPFGYHVFGHRRGQKLFVTGQGDTAQAVFDRLIAIPSLSSMHGNLVLVRSDLMSAADEDDLMSSLTQKIDHTMMLPAIEQNAFTLRHQCNDILKLCAELGKIPART